MPNADDGQVAPSLVGRCLDCGSTVMSDMPRLTIGGRVLHRDCAMQLHADLGAVLDA